MIIPAIIFVVITADQVSKYLVRAFMSPGDSIPLIGDWFRLLHVQNTGTAFSMFAGNKMITIVLTTALVAICLIYVLGEYRRGEKTLANLVTLIFAGGLSNLIDRYRFGFVTDMISCWNFAVFNVADIAVTCGCALTVLYIMGTSRKAMRS
jgi:signal peptidase II